MIALMNFTPSNCPNCGREHKWDTLSRQDWYAGASHTCTCGLHFAYADSRKLHQVASEVTDMGRYVSAEEV